MAVVALGALILCSCRAPFPPSSHPWEARSAAPAALPPEAYAGVPATGAASTVAMADQGVPVPYVPTGPWSPPGISQPWPEDEYLRDGGDRGVPARIGDQWEVQGLEVEDAIAHYDTLDGRRVVEPTNRVHIYSPRFGAVRQVVSLVANEQANRAAGVHFPERLVGPRTLQIAASSKQNIRADRQIGARPPVIYRSRQGDGAMSNATGSRGIQQDFLLPYENLRIIREGTLDAAEMAFLARGQVAALAWSHEQAVQVILDQKAAMAEQAVQTAPSVYTVKEPPAHPKLRVVKVASTAFAEPGDEVAFTIRFDNVGNQTIGNVTIIDNLSTRLQYVPDSAQCSVDARFLTQPNRGDSVALRCEITEPLAAGEGGVIRFRCQVR